jgi:hypothetical protein
VNKDSNGCLIFLVPVRQAIIKMLQEPDEFRLVFVFLDDFPYGSHHRVILSSRELDFSTIISSSVSAREVVNLPHGEK